ncbi:Maf family protein [Povalibacter sp.]|uniref:Maf family protein n=1 Tax=Povalibacter sp. TaxID=1962978 RepID=UPI002F3E5789
MTNSSNSLIWLASASPRRSALLSQIGVAHTVRPVDIDESQRPGELPLDYVRRLAIAKAEALWSQLDVQERAPVLGSDTTVALGNDVLGKPRDRDDAMRILRRLSARTHQVYTAVAVRHPQGCDCRVSVSDVSMRALREEEIAAYWESGEPGDKAGAYGIQGLAALFIERIDGSYSGIVGLPLFETGELLRMAGWSIGKAAVQVGVSA